MKNMVSLDGKTYSLHELAKKYKLSYTSLWRFYQQGFRNEQLLDLALEHRRPTFRFAGMDFSSIMQAARYFEISDQTIRRYLRDGRLHELEKRAKVAEKTNHY